MDLRFDGRVALVTGAARGIGAAIATRLADSGAKTVAADLQAPDLPGVTGLVMDVTDEASVEAGFQQVESELGPVDVLVLNHGVLKKVPLEETTLEEWERHLNVNLTGGFIVAKRALPGMRERRYGRVVAVGSSAGINGAPAAMPGVAAYGASKAGIMCFAKSIAQEFASDGVTANAIAPTLIRTDMAADVPQDFVRSVIPVGRMGEPGEVAALVAFLASDLAGFITGEVVDINGGYLID